MGESDLIKQTLKSNWALPKVTDPECERNLLLAFRTENTMARYVGSPEDPTEASSCSHQMIGDLSAIPTRNRILPQPY